jgi:hypothetical protein
MERAHDRVDPAADTGLTPAQREETAKAIGIAAEIGGFVAARPAPDLTAAVMRRVAAHGPPAAPRPLFLRLAGRLWAPRDVTVSFRPAYGLLAAAALVALAAFLPAGGQQGAIAPADGDPHLLVQFRFQGDADDVRLAGSFSGWEPRYRLNQTTPGIWSITLPLPPGVHDYAFVVDGSTWVADPYAFSVSDGFGGVNSRIAVQAPAVPRS